MPNHRRVTAAELDAALRDLYQDPGESFERTWTSMREALAQSPTSSIPELEYLGEGADHPIDSPDDLALEVIPKGSAVPEPFGAYDVVTSPPANVPKRRPLLVIDEAKGVLGLHVPKGLLAHWASVRLRDGARIYSFGEPLGAAMGPDDAPRAEPLPALTAQVPDQTVHRLLARRNAGGGTKE